MELIIDPTSDAVFPGNYTVPETTTDPNLILTIITKFLFVDCPSAFKIALIISVIIRYISATSFTATKTKEKTTAWFVTHFQPNLLKPFAQERHWLGVPKQVSHGDLQAIHIPVVAGAKIVYPGLHTRQIVAEEHAIHSLEQAKHCPSGTSGVRKYPRSHSTHCPDMKPLHCRQLGINGQERHLPSTRYRLEPIPQSEQVDWSLQDASIMHLPEVKVKGEAQ